MSDDYEPALDMDTTSSREASDVTHHDRVEGAPVAQLSGDDPNKPPMDQRTGPRVVSDKVRAMFRDLASKVKSGEVSIEADDLVPVEHDAPPAAAPVASAVVAAPAPAPAPAPVSAPVPATASPAAQAAAVIQPPPVPRVVPPPVARPDVGSIAEEQRRIALEAREKLLADREAAIAAREKSLPTRERLLDNPVPTLAELIRESYGITDDEDLKNTITDLITEMSEKYHGVQLPAEIKDRVEGRKALRKVKAYTASIDRDKAELAARIEAQAKAEREAREKADLVAQEQRAVEQIGTVLTAAQSQYPYLAVQDNSAAIVWEVLKEAHTQGHKIDWAGAAQFANDYYKTEHERTQADISTRAARLQTLLAPAATQAPAQPAASPGGAPGPAPKQPAAPVTPPSLQPTSQPEDPSDVVGEDRRERRARSLRGLVAKHRLGADQAH